LALLTLARQDAYIATLPYSRVLTLAFVLALITGCAQQNTSLLPNQRDLANGQLPFDHTPDGSGIPAIADLTHYMVPVGTTIVIRLQSPISSVNARAGDLFEGVLDQPIFLRDRRVLPSGIVVRGRVLIAKAGEMQKPGYLRLTLSSILLGNKTFDVYTSSLFAKAGSHLLDEMEGNHQSSTTLTEIAAVPSRNDSRNAQADVKFSTAHRLIFRLVRPLSLPG
jgi:hypothetical protein